MLRGFLGGKLPDLLEPAVHSWHRKTAHSVTSLGGALASVLSGANPQENSRPIRDDHAALGPLHRDHQPHRAMSNPSCLTEVVAPTSSNASAAQEVDVNRAAAGMLGE